MPSLLRRDLKKDNLSVGGWVVGKNSPSPFVSESVCLFLGLFGRCNSSWWWEKGEGGGRLLDLGDEWWKGALNLCSSEDKTKFARKAFTWTGWHPSRGVRRDCFPDRRDGNSSKFCTPIGMIKMQRKKHTQWTLIHWFDWGKKLDSPRMSCRIQRPDCRFFLGDP